MARELQTEDRGGWVEAIGLQQIVRTLGMAISPGKLGLALIAIIATLGLGALLDLLWSGSGGVGASAIDEFIVARQLDVSYDEPDGSSGMFEVWRNHEQHCIEGFLGAVVPPGASSTVAWNNLSGLFHGVWWLASQHIVYFVLLAAGSLLIWSVLGGAICRMAAMEFTREEKPTIKQALAFSRKNLFGGFFLAPCVPLAFIAVTIVLLLLGGMLLRVPILGDLISGLAFFLAIIGGFVIAVLLLGLAIGGSLFWPTVAAEGSDAFDAFSRGLSYTLSKPWKTVIYAVITVVYAAVCWLLAKLFTSMALTVTRAIVALGASWFGLWGRGTEAEPTGKLDLLWPLAGHGLPYARPEWSQLAWYEYFSAFVISAYVLLAIGLLWAFLCSFYFSGSTVVYFLLRRDVDGTDLEEVYEEEQLDEPPPETSAAPAAQPLTSKSQAPTAKPETAASQDDEGTAPSAPSGESDLKSD